MPPKMPKEEEEVDGDVAKALSMLKGVLLKSTTATAQATAASNAASKAVADAMAQLPTVLAQALTGAQPNQQAAAAAPASRDLHDRKIPDFWEAKPTTWFHILDNHFASKGNLTEKAKFGILLPLLTTNAVAKVDRLVKAPPEDVYKIAKETLLLHFERDEMEMVAELHGLSSFGDRSAVDFLEYMRSLQPGEPETKLFRYIFLKCMPNHASAIVAAHDSLDDMAKAADVVLKTVPVADSAHPPGTLMSALSKPDQLVNGLCPIHTKFGQDAFRCSMPESCKMKDIIKKRSGNFRAGRR